MKKQAVRAGRVSVEATCCAEDPLPARSQDLGRDLGEAVCAPRSDRRRHLRLPRRAAPQRDTARPARSDNDRVLLVWLFRDSFLEAASPSSYFSSSPSSSSSAKKKRSLKKNWPLSLGQVDRRREGVLDDGQLFLVDGQSVSHRPRNLGLRRQSAHRAQSRRRETERWRIA